MTKFCPAPWISISTDVNGSIRPCCRYEQPHRQVKYKMPYMNEGNITDLYNGDQMKALREAFLNGEMPYECHWCWKEERAGIKSFRERYIERDYQYDLENPVPQILDLKLSNVCNLKCRMCGAWASSLIAKEQGVQDEYFTANKILGTEQEETFFNDWLPNMKELELTGGEPFFSTENKQLLHRIIDSGHAEHIDLLLTTNAMFYIPSLMEKIKQFKLVTISLSVDDVGPRLEYARKNSKWSTIEQNMIKMVNDYRDYDTNRFYVNIYRTINIYNILYLNDLDQWAMEHDINVCNGMLHSPNELSISNLPDHVKEIVLEKYSSLNDDRYSDVLEYMKEDSYYQGSVKHFYEYNQNLDKIRNESFEEVFPELHNVL